MPQLAAFPKAYLDDLCLTGKMTLREWFELAAITVSHFVFRDLWETDSRNLVGVIVGPNPLFIMHPRARAGRHEAKTPLGTSCGTPGGLMWGYVASSLGAYYLVYVISFS